MNNAYLSLGSNIGNRHKYIERALHLLEGSGSTIVMASAPYETQPWKMSGGNFFINRAVLLRTPLKPLQLLGLMMDIEKRLGRKRTDQQYAPRTLDIDLLLYNDEIINSPKLLVPHPHLAERRFVLEPLCEIAPGVMHPTLGKSIKQLLEQCTDVHKVKLCNT
ncbi:MAG: 2-amino-4-hydroxy-6-hydroxymethyldihydropteridine diphosphokinase [Bacteroidia bacterium]|nr:2-amino-4-hydroxy-6-hydroxymethyldihydropteridine diphosphokinase [Bacteroidia bacterium]